MSMGLLLGSWVHKGSGVEAELLEEDYRYVWYKKPGGRRNRILRRAFLEKWVPAPAQTQTPGESGE